MYNFQTIRQQIILTSTRLTIESLKDRQQFSDPEGIAEKAGISSATWPLFGVVWPAGLMMANLMETYPTGGLKILETGCGLGITSLLLHRRGSNITTNDHHPLAAYFLDKNTTLNHLSPIKHHCSDWATESTHLGYFDLIIGSDLIYEPQQPRLLARFLARHTQPGAQVIIIDPARKQEQRLSHEMKALGFNAYKKAIKQTLPDGTLFKGNQLNYIRCFS